jgi:hypothetical protein
MFASTQPPVLCAVTVRRRSSKKKKNPREKMGECLPDAQLLKADLEFVRRKEGIDQFVTLGRLKRREKGSNKGKQFTSSHSLSSLCTHAHIL